MKREVETVIIGGGISGMSCARQLCDNGRDFLLLTKDLGGRLLSSKGSTVDYGAAYVTADYWNVLRYVDKKERMRNTDFHFANKDGIHTIASWRVLCNLRKVCVFLYHVLRLRRHFLRYRRSAAARTQKELFEADPVLMEYWRTPAKKFIKSHKLEELNDIFGNPLTATTAFTETSNLNTAYFLGMFFTALLPTWIVDFRHTVPRLTKGYRNKIVLCDVLHIRKQRNGTFSIHTNKGDVTAKYVVLAAPARQLRHVYNVPQPYIQQDAYVFHVVGRRRDIFDNKKAILFRPHHYDIFMMWRQKNGADIVYSINPDPDFREYYELYHVVKRVHWQPGMTIPNSRLIDQNLEKNMFLASDYNMSLMEDCFLTGLYAANQIIKKSRTD